MRSEHDIEQSLIFGDIYSAAMDWWRATKTATEVLRDTLEELQSLDPDVRLECANDLYWSIDVPNDILADALGIKKANLAAYIGPQLYFTDDELHTMPYSDYLRTPHWADIRKTVLERAKFRCELCNTRTKLHVHHKTYERRGFEELSDLIVLCADCHAKFHDKLPGSE